MDAATHPAAGIPCNFYCCPPRHALELLAERPASREEVLVNFGPFFANKGWRLVDARRAREADVTEWQQRLFCRIGNGSILATPDPLRTTTAEPWLLFVEGVVL